MTGCIGLILSYFLAPPTIEEAPVVIKIPSNATTGDIAAILRENDLIRNEKVFILYTRFLGIDHALKAGTYEISGSVSVPELAELLLRGQPEVVSFTVPEGYNLQQIADLLEEQGLASRKVFFDAVTQGEFNYSFLPDLNMDKHRLEGYLFPDTYHIGPQTSVNTIIKLMLERFQKFLNQHHYRDLAEQAGLTVHEAVTLASLIEREAQKSYERPLISSVLHNRLKKGMPLQVDATVIYALGKTHKDQVLLKDLEVDSPYNTYKYYGLPPGPIACPGEESLLAAVQPASTDYLYYVAKPDGSHHFSHTLAEHNLYKSRLAN
ncbi:MAG: endolytic transglycosylase MltG [Peptococcaceae bacterium]|nr:endolytic transglycosylase MltG [Peptococcaceae bacterium]